MAAKITKDTNLREVVEKHPETFPVFAEYGIHCIGCALAAFETVEQGAKAHGIDVKKFVADLNKAIGQKARKK